MKKKLVVCLAAAMAMTAAVGTTALAAPGDVNVSYEHTGSNIPGPGEPTVPTVSVTIPSNIRFTGAGHQKQIDIGLVALEGSLADNNNTYVVTVDSLNYDAVESKYYLSDGDQSVEYGVGYTGFTDIGTTGITLNKDNASRPGAAILTGDVAELTAGNSYTDVLTYSVAIQAAQP